jgi:transcriptional regulator with XRE-family HTH domain
MNPEALQKAFGQALRVARERRGLSQAQLARSARLDVKVLGQLELGRMMPAAYTVRVLAEALTVSADELLALLLEGKGEPENPVRVPRELRQVNAILRRWTGDELQKLLRVLRALEEPSPRE